MKPGDMSRGFLLGALLDRSVGQKLGGEAAPQMARQVAPRLVWKHGFR